MSAEIRSPEGLTDAVSLLAEASRALEGIEDGMEPHLQSAAVLLRAEVSRVASRARNLAHVAGQR